MKSRTRLSLLALLVLVVVVVTTCFVACSQTTYSVKFFDEDGKTLIGEAQSIKEGGELTVPQAPKKDGYQFVGWLYEGKEYDFAAEGATKVTKDMAFVAKFQKIIVNYTVKFVMDDGETLVGTAQTVAQGGVFTIPNDPQKEGWTFVGWIKEGETEIYNMKAANARVVNSDLAFKASFTQNTYAIKFMDGETEVGTTQNLHYGDTLTVPTAPSKVGYTFDGWYVGEKKVDFEAEGAKVVKDNATYTAKYSINVYTLTFYGEDGTTVIETISKNYGEAVVFPENEPTKSGFMFKGWLLKTSDGFESTVYDKAEKTVADNMEFKASFDVILTLTFKVEGMQDQEIQVAHGGAYKLPANPTPATGQEFVGWALEGESEVFDFTNKTVTTNQTFVAVFKAISKTVTVKIGGVVKQEVKATYGVGLPADTVLAAPAADKMWLYNIKVNGNAVENLDGIALDALTEDVEISYVYFTPVSDYAGTETYEFTEDGVLLKPQAGYGANVSFVKVDPAGGFYGSFTYVTPKAGDGMVGFMLFDGDKLGPSGNIRIFYFAHWKEVRMSGAVAGWNQRKAINDIGTPALKEVDGQHVATVNFTYKNGVLSLSWQDGGFNIKITDGYTSDGNVAINGLDASKNWKLGFATWSGGNQKQATVTNFSFGTDSATLNCLVGDHEYDEGKVIQAATCTEDGTKKYTCIHCGATKEETIQHMGHVDANDDGICDNCEANIIVITFQDAEGKKISDVTCKKGDAIAFPTEWLTDNTKQINGWQLNGEGEIVTEATVTGNATYKAVIGAKVVNVKFVVAGKDDVNTTATYGVGIPAGVFTEPELLWEYQIAQNGNSINALSDIDFMTLTEDLTITYSVVSKSAKFNGNDVTITGNGYAFLKGVDSAVYLKAILNISNDHQGITIYTDSINGNNAQICFQAKGYTLFKNYSWTQTNTNNVFSNNQMLGLDTAVAGEHTVEYFIIKGKLYIIYDGQNLFDKPLTLSTLNSTFTADAQYHIGIYNFDGNKTLNASAVEVKFGSEVLAKAQGYDTASKTKNATVDESGNVTITGNGYSYYENASNAVYLKTTLNINNDHQGITIYSDFLNGNNAQICFQAQGYTLFQNYAWTKTNTNDVFSNNKMLGIDTAVAGEHTVEYFIIEGKLYIIYDGQNLFDKPLTLSTLNSTFTADAQYHIGIYNFDSNKTLTATNNEVKFGSEAIAKFEAAQSQNA